MMLELVVLERDSRVNSLLRPMEEYILELAVVERGSRAASGVGNPTASAMHRLRVPQILGCEGTSSLRRRSGRHLEQEEAAGIRREPARGRHLEREKAGGIRPELEDSGRRVLGAMPS